MYDGRHIVEASDKSTSAKIGASPVLLGKSSDEDAGPTLSRHIEQPGCLVVSDTVQDIVGIRGYLLLLRVERSGAGSCKILPRLADATRDRTAVCIHHSARCDRVALAQAPNERAVA